MTLTQLLLDPYTIKACPKFFTTHIDSRLETNHAEASWKTVNVLYF